MSLLVDEPVPSAPDNYATDMTALATGDRQVLESLDWFIPMTPGDGPTFTDLFCGAGGSSIGLTEAGMRLVFAANHWRRAIETHSDNFPWADHECADIDHYDMRKLPKTQVLWGSPICTEASPASGNARSRRRPKGQMDLFEEDGHVEQAGFEKTRATFYDIMRATEVRRYDAVILENVPEVAAKWELFDWWVHGMTDVLGYNVQFVSVSSAHVGGEGNPWAPQWRNRLYIVLTRKGIRLPDVDPKPMAWCQACDEVVYAMQAWKKPGRKIGKYGEQYVYVCPNTRCAHALVEPFVLPAATAIDWTDLGRPIGERKRTAAKPEGLAPSTMMRIRAGVPLLDQPASVPFLTLLRSGRIRNISPDAEPFASIMASGSGHGLVVPVGGNNHDQPAEGLDVPFRTRVTRETDAIVIPPDAFLIKNKGGYCSPEHNFSPAGLPVSTVTGTDSHALVVPYRKARATTTGDPFHTMATKDSAALVSPDVTDISEWRLRMLKPREHLRAQRFRDTYRVHGNPGEQTMQAGNAVSANAAHFFGAAVMKVL